MDAQGHHPNWLNYTFCCQTCDIQICLDTEGSCLWMISKRRYIIQWVDFRNVYHVLSTVWSTSQRLFCLEVDRWRASLQQRALTQLVQQSVGTEQGSVQGGALSLSASFSFACGELTFWAYCIYSVKLCWKIIWHCRHLVAFLEASVGSIWQGTQELEYRKREREFKYKESWLNGIF